MAGHAQLNFVMTECSKTEIRLTGLICLVIVPFTKMSSDSFLFEFCGKRKFLVRIKVDFNY